MDCCGTAFTIGSQVSWTVGTGDASWLSALFGADASVRIDVFEDHHGDLPDETPPASGTVRAIMAVYCRYAARAGREGDFWQVPGSGVLLPEVLNPRARSGK